LLDSDALNKTHIYSPARWEPIQCPKTGMCTCKNSFNQKGDERSFGALGSCADTYVFKPPLPEDLVTTSTIDFFFGGHLGAENVFIYELKKRNYTFSNPCRTLVLMHHHCSNLRPFSWNESAALNRQGRDASAGPSSCLDRVKRVGPARPLDPDFD